MIYIKDNRNHWTVVVNGKTFQFDASHKNYTKLVQAVKDDNQLGFESIYSVGHTIHNWSHGEFQFRNGLLWFKNEQVDDAMTERMVELIEENFDYAPMLNFMRNLYSNTSMRSVQQLYKFLSRKYLPITEDGCFIGHKGVAKHFGNDIVDLMGRVVTDGDLIDKYTMKSYRNNPGDVNVMERRLVMDNPDVHCDEGLHVGSLEYARGWGNIVVMVKVNPADAVSVPKDCSFQKLRCCRYEVLAVEEGEFHNRPVHVEDDIEDEDEDWDDFADDLYEETAFLDDIDF